MNHLSPAELLDIVEGTCPEPSHVAGCQSCRLQLDEARAMMAAISNVEVPEPSPLFFDHLSSRIAGAVRAEAPPRYAWFMSWRVAVPAVVCAAAVAIVLAVTVGRRSPIAAPAAGAPFGGAPGAGVLASAAVAAPVQTDGRPLLGDTGADPSFSFVADLTSGMDMDTAVEAGLVSDDSADHAVTHLSESELRALANLLRAELAKGQAS